MPSNCLSEFIDSCHPLKASDLLRLHKRFHWIVFKAGTKALMRRDHDGKAIVGDAAIEEPDPIPTTAQEMDVAKMDTRVRKGLLGQSGELVSVPRKHERIVGREFERLEVGVKNRWSLERHECKHLNPRRVKQHEIRLQL
jgi:hypothetical protein